MSHTPNNEYLEQQAERLVETVETEIETGWNELVEQGLSHLITKEDYRARLIASLEEINEEAETKLWSKTK